MWKYIRPWKSQKHHRGFELEVLKEGKWWWWSVWRPDDYYASGKSRHFSSAHN